MYVCTVMGIYYDISIGQWKAREERWKVRQHHVPERGHVRPTLAIIQMSAGNLYEIALIDQIIL